MSFYFRVAWYGRDNGKLEAFSFFRNKKIAREFINSYVEAASFGKGLDLALSPLPATVKPSYQEGKVIADRVHIVDEDLQILNGPKFDKKMRRRPKPQEFFVLRTGPTESWHEARTLTTANKKHKLGYRKAGLDLTEPKTEAPTVVSFISRAEFDARYRRPSQAKTSAP